MSARVFNPVIMSEMRMLRGPGGSAVVTCTENGTQPSVQRSRNREADRVRRDLFGPVDHNEARRLMEQELSEQQRRDSDRWGFDFEKETPRLSGPGTSRYVWEKVTPGEKIPGPYALGRMEFLSRCAAEDAVTATEVEQANATTINQQSRITGKYNIQFVTRNNDLFKLSNNLYELSRRFIHS